MSDFPANEEIDFPKISQEFDNKVNSIRISPDTLILVLQYAIETVEMTQLTGIDKKNAATYLVRRVVIHTEMEESTKKLLLELIDGGIMGYTIDIIVAASKGKVHINGVINASKILCIPVCSRMVSCIKRRY